MGLAEAARECGISVSTLRRRKESLIEAGATVTPKGWQIPIPALVSLGYLGSTTPPPATFQETPMAPATEPLFENPRDTALAELDSLRARLADAERRAAVAEAIAGERERVIQAQAVTLRMLERGSSGSPSDGLPDTLGETPYDSPLTAPVAASEGRARRRWPWSR